MYYKLVNKIPVECSLMELGRQFDSENDRHIGNDELVDSAGNKVSVSTVFLALDHSFGGGTPTLFETMIFGGEYDGYQERYCTYDEAVEGHKKAVDLVNLKP